MSRFDIPIIVTRAEPGAAETVARLRARGREAVSAPMLTLHELTETDLPTASDLSGLIFTSANGVRTYARRALEQIALCPPGVSAQRQRRRRARPDLRTFGNQQAMPRILPTLSPGDAKPDDGPLVHVANSAAAGQLQRDLTNRGFKVTFAPLYRNAPCAKLTRCRCPPHCCGNTRNSTPPFSQRRSGDRGSDWRHPPTLGPWSRSPNRRLSPWPHHSRIDLYCSQTCQTKMD